MHMAQSVDGKAEYLFNPDEPRFANPVSMIREVQGNFAMSDAEIVWTIYNSLARRYGEVFRMMQSLAPWPIELLYVIGGGARNKYLMKEAFIQAGIPCARHVKAQSVGDVLAGAKEITVKKQAENGMTFALGKYEEVIHFE